MVLLIKRRPATYRPLTCRLLVWMVPFFLATCAVSLAADLTPEGIVLKHLDSIGTAQARSGLKSRVVQGAATYRILVGGSGAISAAYTFASQGRQSDFVFKTNANGYLGEQFICNGDKVSVAGTYPDKHRSEFGVFILSQDVLLRDNLLGGVWSSDWALMDIESRRAKLHYEGIKKIDGRDLIALRYLPRKYEDLDVFLYFDPQTYQHVMSIYKVTVGVGIGFGGEKSSARRQETRYRLEERFSDFKTTDGLTLPTHYDLRYTFEAASGFTKSVEWEVTAKDIMNNQSIDARSFQVQ
jgi:hypothetical protein